MTVNAFNSETIQEAGINNAGDLAIMTPALNINVNLSPFNARMTIRGIGTAQTDPALEPSVGLFVDGVFLGRSGLGMSDLTDIERIEVLQGPTGYAVRQKHQCRAPSVLLPRGPISRSSRATWKPRRAITACTGSPPPPPAHLTDTLAYRLSGNVHQRDGYYDNSAGDDLNDADDWNIQGKLQWEPTDSLSILLSGSHIDRDTTCCAADAVQSESVNNELADQGFARTKTIPMTTTYSPASTTALTWNQTCYR